MCAYADVHHINSRAPCYHVVGPPKTGNLDGTHPNYCLGMLRYVDFTMYSALETVDIPSSNVHQ